MAIPMGATDVTTATQAAEAARALATAAELAVDVEADSMHHFHARLCFVQVGTDTDIFLFDTLVPEVRAAELAALFADPERTKFFHSASGDLQYLAEAGVRVKGLFDTHRAATLLGWPKVGLADLVLEKLGKTLQKEHQQADFSLRPLPPELRAYIADDVRYLVEVGRMVRDACAAADILEEVELDCARLADEAAERPDVSLEYRVKLPKQGLSDGQRTAAEALAWALHQRRLDWAKAEDLPMGRMLSNAAIGAVATRFPATARDLARCEGVRGAFVRQHGEAVLALVRDVLQRSRDGALPPRPEAPRPDPLQRKRIDALLQWRKATATQRKVTPSVVLPNALLDDLASRAPRSPAELEATPYLGKKRLSLYGEEILGLLARR